MFEFICNLYFAIFKGIYDNFRNPENSLSVKFSILFNEIFLQEISHRILKNCALSIFFNANLDPEYSPLNFFLRY